MTIAGTDKKLDATTRTHLTSIYGSRAREVLDLARTDPSLGSPLCPHHRGIEAEIVHGVQNEWAQTLGDVLLRRNALGLSACQARFAVRSPRVTLGWVGNRPFDQRRTREERVGIAPKAR